MARRIDSRPEFEEAMKRRGISIETCEPPHGDMFIFYVGIEATIPGRNSDVVHGFNEARYGNLPISLTYDEYLMIYDLRVKKYQEQEG